MWIVVTHEKTTPDGGERDIDGMPLGMPWEPLQHIGPFPSMEEAEACKDSLDEGREEIRQSYIVKLETWSPPAG